MVTLIGKAVTFNGQEVAMDLDIGPNMRKRFTELDFAAMKHVGWKFHLFLKPKPGECY